MAIKRRIVGTTSGASASEAPSAQPGAPEAHGAMPESSVEDDSVASLPPQPAGVDMTGIGEHPPAAVDVSLLANFTHQIINPLNAVLGTIDNLVDGTINESRREQRTRVIRAQLISTIELVRNLAYLSQLSTEVGRSGLRDKSAGVSIPATIIEAIQLLQEVAMAERRNIKIHLADRETTHMVKGHKALIKQVWMNIIENAVKYSDDETTITIRVRAKAEPDNPLLVEVESYGPGFAPEERDRIFELGFRGADVQTTRASGSGLGLYICKQILGLHDARIEPEYSPRTRLTRFRVRFRKSWVDLAETDRLRRSRRD